ncbi:copper resistance protein NlpE [Methylibium sp. T29-B]|uniref:copper resistance protein NlpE n=1 Tax=Methylibium sp. T29-B TaxID=1437443 RepID=UPI0018CC6B93|nr:copper resistance protein NlpE [Methylibium sp. T29-B]
MPATFAGVLPCADCAGVAQTLTLRADGLYRLRRTYLGKPEGPFSELGHWKLNAAGTLLMLRGETDTLLFAVMPRTPRTRAAAPARPPRPAHRVGRQPGPAPHGGARPGGVHRLRRRRARARRRRWAGQR